jgi:hypothetical protein
VISSLLVGSLVLGCGADVQTAGEKLERDLPRTFPGRVADVVFENSPPLDPPTLWVEVDPAMSPEEQRVFLCSELAPHVSEMHDEILVTVNYGWWSSDC